MNVIDYFMELTKIPHGSGNEKQISDYLYCFADERGYHVVQDAVLNIIVDVPASAGREDESTVILQGHMDMVCAKNANSDHDFLKDPLEVFVDGDWLHANGTTLGGDDGIAVAYMMALMDDPSISHPPMQMIITVSEETGMDGVIGLDPSLVKGTKLINIDSEDEGCFTCGCAGGMRMHITADLTRDKAYPNQKAFKISVEGGLGGHSGAEIDKNRANAIKLLGKALSICCSKDEHIRIADLCGGEKDNAIPREAYALVWANPETLFFALDCITCLGMDPTKEYIFNEPDLRLNVDEYDENAMPAPLSADDTKRVLNFIKACPTGVLSMSKSLAGKVETSQNLAIIKLNGNELEIHVSVRSNVDGLMEKLKQDNLTLAENVGFTAAAKDPYPAWNYREDSALRDQMVELYREMYQKEPTVDIIHAGLECGIFAKKNANMDMVSMGPDMQDIHTPGEKLCISSVNRVWEYLVRLLAIRDAG